MPGVGNRSLTRRSNCREHEDRNIYRLLPVRPFQGRVGLVGPGTGGVAALAPGYYYSEQVMLNMSQMREPRESKSACIMVVQH